MPELPEVETVCRFLDKELAQDKITRVTVNRFDLRIGSSVPRDFASAVTGLSVTEVKRKGKYILINLTEDKTIIVHLGMTGRLIIYPDHDFTGKHNHIIWQFSSRRFLVFSDPRRFGLVTLSATKDISSHKLFCHTGIDPLTDEFTGEFLHQAFAGRKTPIKVALLDQSIVAGLGNIYVCEALFKEKISPLRPAGTITVSESARLVRVIKELLQASITAGGTTFRDYRKADGEKGSFVSQLAVYGKEGQKCPACEFKDICEGIQRIVLGGRSTFYCSRVQK